MFCVSSIGGSRGLFSVWILLVQITPHSQLFCFSVLAISSSVVLTVFTEADHLLWSQHYSFKTKLEVSISFEDDSSSSASHCSFLLEKVKTCSESRNIYIFLSHLDYRISNQ